VHRLAGSLTLRVLASRPPGIVPLDSSLPSVTVTRVRFPALDGYSLGGFLHAGANPDPRHAVVFATGGGVRAEVYRHFLTYLASHGMAVLAFDYRGIGESRPPRLRGFVAGFEDWAEYDAGGAIAWMAGRYPNACLTGMGHSIGGVMIGASELARTFNQLVLIAPHTGYQGDYQIPLRWVVRIVWGTAGPPLRKLFGYFPASLLGLGEDLPARVSIQWGTHTQPRIRVGAHGGDPIREQKLLDQVAALQKPALVLSALDDPWASETGIRRALFAYRNLILVRRVIDPASLQVNYVGHWGYFRRRNAAAMWLPISSFISDEPLSEFRSIHLEQTNHEYHAVGT
jgi:predicted alpha/beta hydrolase